MTRLPLLDPHAQAASRIAGRGYVILPAHPSPAGPVQPGQLTVYPDMPKSDMALVCPFPPAGEVFFVGESAIIGWSAWPVRELLYRANGDTKPDPRYRWRPASWLEEKHARTRFRVLSRSALRLGDVTEEMMSGLGLPMCDVCMVLPDGDLTAFPLTAFRHWWTPWTKQPYNPQSWAFAAHVERLP